MTLAFSAYYKFNFHRFVLCNWRWQNFLLKKHVFYTENCCRFLKFFNGKNPLLRVIYLAHPLASLLSMLRRRFTHSLFGLYTGTSIIIARGNLLSKKVGSCHVLHLVWNLTWSDQLCTWWFSHLVTRHHDIGPLKRGKQRAQGFMVRRRNAKLVAMAVYCAGYTLGLHLTKIYHLTKLKPYILLFQVL